MSESALERLRPLSDWVWCDVTIHFVGGGVVSTPMSQADARRLSETLTGEWSSSRISWSAKRWITFAEDRVDLLEVKVRPDCGWGGLTTLERERFGEGLRHGILRALVDLHSERGGREPSYAATTLSYLHILMRQDPTADFAIYADGLEGEAGVKFVECVKRGEGVGAADSDSGSAHEGGIGPDKPDGADASDAHRAQEDDGA